MASLLNNAGVQHYANKMVLAENRKVGSKNLPTALTDIDNLIDEMKTHFDAEYGSALDMKLDNNENVFSVGTGTNIDKRSEVENSFTDVELSGNSLVNLVSTKGSNLFGTSGSGVPFNRTYNTDLTRCIYTTQEETGSYITIRTGSKERIKSNTTYTLIFNIFKNNISELQKGISIRGSSDPYYTQTVSAPYFNIYTDSNFNITSGIKVISFTTGNNANEYTGFGFGFPSVKTNVAGQQFEIGDVILLEGDYTNKPIPQYFEDMKSVGQDDVNGHKIEILSQNKNLLPLSHVSTDSEGYGNRQSSNWDNVRLKPNTKYTLSYTGKATNYTNNYMWGIWIREQKTGKAITDNHIIKSEVTDISLSFTTTNEEYYKIQLVPNNGDNTGSYLFKPNTVILEEGEKTSYVPYALNKKEILLNEPLRGLPNGVKDTIEKINGEWKIVRRCGEIIFDGSETWRRSANSDLKELTSHFGATNFKLSSSTIICDKYKCVNIPLVDCEEEAVKVSGEFWVNINKSRLSTDTVAGFKEWLSQNNIRVIYKLETPIIEDISPITLQCWKNGTISIDEVLPVETTHTVALNKPAQIKRNIEELTALRKRVQALEYFYDQVALEQAHQLSLLNHSIELDYDI